MSVLARLHSAQIANGEVIDADDLGEEYDQIVNLLNGTSNNKEAIIKLTSPTVAPLTLNQLNAAGPVQLWQVNTVDKLKVNASGQLESLLATGTAPFVVASTTKVANLNADLLDGLDSTAFAILATAKVSFSASFTINSPATANLNSREFGCAIIPAGGSYTVTKCKVMFRQGSHTPGSSITFKVDQSGVGDKATLVINDTNNTAGVVYTDDIVDFSVAENAILSCYISLRSGTITETDVSVVIEGYRTIFV